MLTMKTVRVLARFHRGTKNGDSADDRLECSVRSLVLSDDTKHGHKWIKAFSASPSERAGITDRFQKSLQDGFSVIRAAVDRMISSGNGGTKNENTNFYVSKVEVSCNCCQRQQTHEQRQQTHYISMADVSEEGHFECPVSKTMVTVKDLGVDEAEPTGSCCSHDGGLEEDMDSPVGKTCPVCWTGDNRLVCQQCHMCRRCIQWYSDGFSASSSSSSSNFRTTNNSEGSNSVFGENRVFRCPSCSQSFPSRLQLAGHLSDPCIRLSGNVDDDDDVDYSTSIKPSFEALKSDGYPLIERNAKEDDYTDGWTTYECLRYPFLLRFILCPMVTGKSFTVHPKKHSEMSGMYLVAKLTETGPLEYLSIDERVREVVVSRLTSSSNKKGNLENNMPVAVSVTVNGEAIGNNWMVAPQPDYPVISLVFPSRGSAATVRYNNSTGNGGDGGQKILKPILVPLKPGLKLEALIASQPNMLMWGAVEIEDFDTGSKMKIVYKRQPEFKAMKPLNSLDFRPVDFHRWNPQKDRADFYEPGGREEWRNDNGEDAEFNWTDHMLLSLNGNGGPIPLEFFSRDQLAGAEVAAGGIRDQKFEWPSVLLNAAKSVRWARGQKLEAISPKRGGTGLSVCTVLSLVPAGDKIGSERVLIGIDGTGSSGYFTVKTTYEGLHPIGFAAANDGLALNTPSSGKPRRAKGGQQQPGEIASAEFDWGQYLATAGCSPVPWEAFTTEQRSDAGTGLEIEKPLELFRLYDSIRQIDAGANSFMAGNLQGKSTTSTNNKEKNDKDFFFNNACRFLFADSTERPNYWILPKLDALVSPLVPVNYQSIFSVNHDLKKAYVHGVVSRNLGQNETFTVQEEAGTGAGNWDYFLREQDADVSLGKLDWQEDSKYEIRRFVHKIALLLFHTARKMLTNPRPTMPASGGRPNQKYLKSYELLEILHRRVLVDYFNLTILSPSLVGPYTKEEYTTAIGNAHLLQLIDQQEISTVSYQPGNTDGSGIKLIDLDIGKSSIKHVNDLEALICRSHSLRRLSLAGPTIEGSRGGTNGGLLKSSLTRHLSPTLTYLNLSWTPLRRIPETIAHLAMLKHLNLCACGLDHLEYIWHLPRLETLNVTNNLLETLPTELTLLRNLRALYASGVPLFHNWKEGDSPITMDMLRIQLKRCHVPVEYPANQHNRKKKTSKSKVGGSSMSFMSQFSSMPRRSTNIDDNDDLDTDEDEKPSAQGVQYALNEFIRMRINNRRSRSGENVEGGGMSNEAFDDGAHLLSKFQATPADTPMAVGVLNEFLAYLAPRFTEFPPVIYSLTNLRYLSLANHQFVDILPSIADLEHLQQMDLGQCSRLISLPGHVGQLPLKNLKLTGCVQLKTPPVEIVRRGHDSIMAYLKRLMSGSKPCKRTKLMLVGLGGAGKTSLVEALTNGQGKTKPGGETEVTDGIDIKEWSVRVPDFTSQKVRQNENHKQEQQQEIALHYSVWDFAGQSVYYNTHQFFLSNRAVYFLLWNTRLGYEHAGLEFWLSSICCHAPKACIFVIGTHADLVQRADLPKHELQKTFPQIVQFISVSAVTGLNMSNLTQDLFKVTQLQSYMGEQVPTVWLQLEQQILLARRTKNILDYPAVEKDALELGMMDPTEVREALAFLHELGSLQYFPSEFLRHRVVINPQWLVDVMAALISVKETLIHEGRFKRSDIDTIWRDYSPDLRPWLLRLTEEFDLTFSLPEGDVNIVPCLLPPQEPEFEWPKLEGDMREMKMTYLFDYLPAGLFNRAQTRLCHYSDSHIIWKKGSLLHKNNQRALIRQTRERELLILVQGLRPENILFMVHEVIEGLINEFFSGVSYDISIPCADCVHSGSQDPHMFFARNIRRAGDMKAPFLQCSKNFHIVGLDALRQFLPPDKPGELEQHLTGLMQDLNELRSTALTPKVIILCASHDNRNKSSSGSSGQNSSSGGRVTPSKIVADLKAAGVNVKVLEDSLRQNVAELGAEVASSLLIVAIISRYFCKEKFCSDIYQFVKRSSQRPVIPVILTESANWASTTVGMLLANELYVDMTKAERYQRKLKELLARIEAKCSLFGMSKNAGSRSTRMHSVFVSYCWQNSKDAVTKGTRQVDDALGPIDPRFVAEYLEEHNVPVWVDTSFKEGVLFEEIADALRRSKLLLACVSDQYMNSRNCMLEFRFAEPDSMLMLMERIKDVIGDQQVPRPTKTAVGTRAGSRQKAKEKEQNTMAYNEMCEFAQRKFLQQVIKVSNKLRGSVSSFSDPYPRLYVLDVLDKEVESLKALKKRSASADSLMGDDEIQTTDDPPGNNPKGYPEEIESTIPLNKEDLDANSDGEVTDEEIRKALLTIPTDQFCIRLLCESEKGWHVHGAPLPVGSSTSWVSTGQPVTVMSVENREKTFGNLAPYLSPLYSIIQHSGPITLNILQIPNVIHFFKRLSGAEGVKETMFDVAYMQIGDLARAGDAETYRGGLLRGSLASRRVLWLCSEHCKSDARHVNDNDEILMEDLILSPVTASQFGMGSQPSTYNSNNNANSNNRSAAALTGELTSPTLALNDLKEEGEENESVVDLKSRIVGISSQQNHDVTRKASNKSSKTCAIL